jgi:hypothetical protein
LGNILRKTFISLFIASALSTPATLYCKQLYLLEQVVDQNGQPISDWIEYNQAFTIKLVTDSSQPQAPKTKSQFQLNQPEEFQVMLGDADISSFFEFQKNQLIFSGGLPLPAGENQLTVNQLIEGQWIEAGSSQLSVMSSSGFKQAEWTKTLEINLNSQLDEKVSGDATPSDKPQYTEVTTSIGISSHHENDNYSINSQINLLHVSNREQAIQFNGRLIQASKLDISDYSASVIAGNHQINIGHTSFGNNALLIDGLSRRGISWQYQNENELTFNGAILSGSDLVGYNNLLGLSDYSEQFVNSLGFGFNTFTDSRISLRIEGSYLDAERKSQNDFGIGEVASAESNQGIGFRLIATDSEDKLSGDLTFGFSRYDNPDDFELNQGDVLVALETDVAVAYNLNLSYKLLQDWQSPWGSLGNITLNANQSSAEPLYQTLTAYVQANVENKLLDAQYQFGNISGNLTYQTSRDNLDNLINLLTTKTNNSSFSSNLPLAQIFQNDKDGSTPANWLPSIDYSFQKTHQFAINSPNEETSGFNDESHLPDQLTTSHNLASNWQLETISFSLQSSHSFQDNRQIGRENSDFSSLQHSVSTNWQQNESTAWSLSLGKNRQADIENNKNLYSQSVSISYNWQSIDGLGINLNYGLSKDKDSLKEASSLSTNADLALVKSLIEGEWWLPISGSISLRINYNDGETIDNVFDQSSRFGTKTAQLGFSFSL